MDDLERDLHATFGNLADGAAPSDELVGRTLSRSAQLRRNRRVVTASSLAVVAVVVTVAIASFGATTHNSHVQVSGPQTDEPTDTTTTMEATTTTVAPPGPPVTTHHPKGSAGATTSTTAPYCPPPSVVDATSSTSFELQPNGDITVVVQLPFGPGALLTPLTMDDGTSSPGGFQKVYTPAEFGVHYYDLMSSEYAGHACPERFTYDVEPSSVTPSTTTTSSEPTTTTTNPDTPTSVG